MSSPHSLEGLFLCALRTGPDYGHNLVARITSLDPTFSPGSGSIYPALRRLEKAGFTRCELVPQRTDRGGLPRRVHTLTAKGRRRAEQLAHLFRALGTAA